MSAKSISNVFKIFGAVSLAGLLSVASLQADEISEAQVTQAEQSTQEQKVDSASESKSINTNANASKANKSGAFGFCKGQHASTGCFIGASVGLAFGENWLSIPSTEILESSLEKNFVTVPVNIDFGWQWYYAQNAGFRFKGYVGYSNYNSKLGSFTEIGANNGSDLIYDMSASVHALQYGLEASYLYDFIYKGDHNFGAHISVGFEGSTFMGQNINEGDYKIDFAGYSKFTWTSGIGIHYFYKVHHQFFLSYLYRGYTNSKMAENKVDGAYAPDGTFEEYLPAGAFKLSTTPNSTIMLSYAYKF